MRNHRHRRVNHTEAGDQLVYEVDSIQVTQIHVVKPPSLIITFWWMLRLWLKEKFRK